MNQCISNEFTRTHYRSFELQFQSVFFSMNNEQNSSNEIGRKNSRLNQSQIITMCTSPISKLRIHHVSEKTIAYNMSRPLTPTSSHYNVKCIFFSSKLHIKYNKIFNSDIFSTNTFSGIFMPLENSAW
uniref:Uncharacterized protein n=1 Tax=Cacopsylla melanoneura TaxID=428564 RepID=A0A8D8TZK7_9HEMI